MVWEVLLSEKKLWIVCIASCRKIWEKCWELWYDQLIMDNDILYSSLAKNLWKIYYIKCSWSCFLATLADVSFWLSDSFDMEFVENNKVSELGQEPIETNKCRDDLEESCIFVNGDELHFDLQGTRKHKSYKVSLCLSVTLSLCITSILLSGEMYFRKGSAKHFHPSWDQGKMSSMSRPKTSKRGGVVLVLMIPRNRNCRLVNLLNQIGSFFRRLLYMNMKML